MQQIKDYVDDFKTDHMLRVKKLLNGIREKGELPYLPESPEVPTKQHILAQCKLILEETFEVLDAAGIRIHLNGDDYTRDDNLTYEDLCLDLYYGWDERFVNLSELIKEVADLSVVTTGLFCECGVDDEPILHAVDSNNLDKLGPGGYLDNNRKWRKPPNHPKPNIAALLKRQGWQKEKEVDNENSKEETVSCGNSKQ